MLLSQTFVHVVHQTQVERHPLACQLEDINQFIEKHLLNQSERVTLAQRANKISHV